MNYTIDFGIPAPQDRILEESRLKLAIARERIQDLSTLGITAEWLNQLEQDIGKAVSIPTYDEQRHTLKQLTATKDEKLQACVQWGRKLRFRMSIAFGRKQTAGIQFPSKEWNQAEKNESRLITLWPTLIQIAKEHAQVLVTAGQTAADIEQGLQLLQELVAANQAQEEYNLRRTSVTVERRVAYRNLYDSINRINHSGQMIYGAESAESRLFRTPWVQTGDDTNDDVMEVLTTEESLDISS